MGWNYIATFSMDYCGWGTKASVLDGVAYIIGGRNGYTGASTNACFTWNSGTGALTQITNFPYPIQQASIFALSGKIYAGLGHDGVNFHSELYRYDAGTWTAIPSFPGSGRIWAAVGTWRDKVVIAKGQFATGGSNTLYYSDSTVSAWIQGATPPGNDVISSPGSAMAGSLLCCAGGLSGSSVDAAYYNVMSDSWINLPDLPSPRRAMVGWAVGPYFFVGGGYSDSGSGNQFEMWHIDTRGIGGWVSDPSLPITSTPWYATHWTIGSKLYVFDVLVNSLWEYDTGIQLNRCTSVN